MLSVLFQSVAFANISSSTTDGLTQIYSNYTVKYQYENSPAPYECQVVFNASMIRSFNILVYDESRYFTIATFSGNEKNNETGIVFSRKTVPIIQAEKNGKVVAIELKKVDGVGSSWIMFKMNKNALNDIYDADKVSIAFPTKNSNLKRIIEVPKEAVNEWKEVFYADMEKVRKDLIH